MLSWLIDNDRRQLQQLLDILDEIALMGDQDMLLERILLGARTLVHAEAGTIYRRQGGSLIFRYVQNDVLRHQFVSELEKLHHTIVPINNTSISGYVAQTGKMINVHDVYNLNPQLIPYTFDRSYDEHSRYRTRSMLTLPLKNRNDRILGVLQLINARNQDGKIIPFFGTDLPFIRTLTDIAAKVLEYSWKDRIPFHAIPRRSTTLAGNRRRIGRR